jgi:hypothetical protein
MVEEMALGGDYRSGTVEFVLTLIGHLQGPWVLKRI